MKKLISFLLLIISLLSLSGCGKKSNQFQVVTFTSDKTEYVVDEAVSLLINTKGITGVTIKQIYINDQEVEFTINGDKIKVDGYTFKSSTRYILNRINYKIGNTNYIMKVGRSAVTNPEDLSIVSYVIPEMKKEYKIKETIPLEITIKNDNQKHIKSFVIQGKEYFVTENNTGTLFKFDYQLGNERATEQIMVESINFLGDDGAVKTISANVGILVEVRPIIPLLIILIVILILVVAYFTQDAIGAEVYEKKGYTRFRGAILCLIPVYGIIRAFKAPAIKEVQKGTLRHFYKPKEILMKVITFTQLFVLAVIVVIPIIYLVGSSFSKTSGLPSTFWPKNLTLNNYDKLFDTKFVDWYKNTILIALINMVVGVVFITGASYVFARFKFKGKKMGLMTILILQVFPSFMGLIAMFTLFETFGMLGRPLALSILYIGGAVPYNLWLIKGYLQQIPKDLDESAMLDGANKWQIFSKIILPLSVPIISFVAVSLFMAPWMDFMLPKFLLDVPAKGSVGDAESIKSQWTLAVGLFEMISGADKQNYTTFAAGALIVALPITVLYMIFQRYLIQGITAGATKG